MVHRFQICIDSRKHALEGFNDGFCNLLMQEYFRTFICVTNSFINIPYFGDLVRLSQFFLFHSFHLFLDHARTANFLLKLCIQKGIWADSVQPSLHLVRFVVEGVLKLVTSNSLVSAGYTFPYHFSMLKAILSLIITILGKYIMKFVWS